MDYIQQAIDKARQERNNEPADNSASHGQPTSSTDDGVPSINYTQTRRVKLSDKVLRSNRIIAGFSDDRRAEVYRQLRTQVIQKLRSNNWKTLAVTSPKPSAGKTMTAVNLAISLSKEVNQTVLLVDLELTNPGVHKALGIDVEYGILEYINSDRNIADLLVNPDMERLVILPSAGDANYSSEQLSTPKMQSLLDDLATRYDSRIVIFDIPSLLVNDDALIFTPFVDAALLVIEDGVTTTDELEQSLQMLEGTNVLGTVLNKSDET